MIQLLVVLIYFNNTEMETTDEGKFWFDENEYLFWVLVVLSSLIACAGVIGNALVMFIAIKNEDISASFRYLNRVVLSLAVADFCFLFIGEPFYIMYWYWGTTFFQFYILTGFGD